LDCGLLPGVLRQALLRGGHRHEEVPSLDVKAAVREDGHEPREGTLSGGDGAGGEGMAAVLNLGKSSKGRDQFMSGRRRGSCGAADTGKEGGTRGWRGSVVRVGSVLPAQSKVPGAE
jgi:hypothetical protein